MKNEELGVIRRIASVVGHELRNPLAVINNSAYFLKTKLGQDGRLDPKVDKHLGIVSSEIGRLNGMIEDILIYSRPMEIEKEPLDLAPIVAAAAAALAPPSTVKLEVKAPKKGLDVAGDEKLLGDAVRRLLDNAVQALPDGGKIVLSAEAGAKEVVVTVEDDGKGFETKALELFGQAFATTKPRGLGLGLAMTRKVMEAHGGRLEGGNKKGAGACVKLVLPKHG